MNFFDFHKCPNCKDGVLGGRPTTAAGFSGMEICNRCGFKRPFTYLTCGLCGKWDSVSKFTKTENTYLHHDSECKRKSASRTIRRIKVSESRVKAAINYEVERGKLIDYLAELTYSEIDALWAQKAWLEPNSIPSTPDLDDDEIKELIEVVRRAKFQSHG